jgi:hypothetical protein
MASGCGSDSVVGRGRQPLANLVALLGLLLTMVSFGRVPLAPARDIEHAERY